MTTALAEPGLYRERHTDLYPASMVKRVLRGVQEIRLQMGDVFKAIEDRKEHIVFTRRGKPTAVLVPMDWYREAAKAVNDPTEF